MNKKEQAYVESLETRLALRFTEPVTKDLPIPKSSTSLVCGWSYNTHTLQAYKSCSSNVFHGNGWEDTTSQRPIAQYSTQKRALRAMRYEVEMECAHKLRKIDKDIAECSD